MVKVCDWANTNGHSLYAKKTQPIVIYKKYVDTTTLPELSLNDEYIVFREKVKSLGLIINKTLNWNDYLNALSARVHLLCIGH